MCIRVKNHIVTCEKCMFWCEKGYKWIGVLGSPKTYYSSSSKCEIDALEERNLFSISLAEIVLVFFQ